MSENQTISDFLQFARRQVEVLSVQLRKENPKFKEFLDWEATVRSIEQSMANGIKPASAFRSSPASEVTRACVQIMEEIDEPIPVKELLAYLEERGIIISGTQPVRNLSSKLSTSRQFESLPGQGWVLAERLGDYFDKEISDPPPPAGG